MQREMRKVSPKVRMEQEQLLKDLKEEHKKLLEEMKSQGPSSTDNPRASFYYEERTRLEYMINSLQSDILSSVVSEMEHAANGAIDFGDIVICREVETNNIVKFQLSEQMEIPNASSDIRKVTKQAPIGKALDGKKTGDVVSISIPQGRWGGTLTRTLEILEVIQEQSQAKQLGEE